MTPSRKAIRAIGLIFAVYGLLVATHKGEFWPFSIYPMFSQAGTPWTRSLVREIPADVDPATVDWKTTTLEDLPGEPYPLMPQRIHQNDVSNYLSKTKAWTDERIQGFRSVFTKGRTLEQPLLILRARGELHGDSVAVSVTPVMLFTSDTTYLHPDPEARLPGRTVANPSSVD